MKKVFLIPNAITAFGLICGLFVIFKVNMVEIGVNTYQLLYSSILLLLVAALADVLDGAVARLIRAESEFGAIFDSLADVVSFGVAPSVLFLKHLGLEQGTWLSLFAAIGAILFSVCGVLRLVRFNTKALTPSKSVEETAAQKRNFTGLPIPAAAMAAVSANLFFVTPFAQKFLNLTSDGVAIILTCTMIVLAFFMVSRWKFPSLKVLNFRGPSFQLVLMTVLIAIVLLYGILNFLPLLIVAVAWGYIVLGWVLSLIRLIAGKKSKTLRDFELDDEDNE
jgi:CDP-diacylglycerol---serine O-phosphatidyltransferase